MAKPANELDAALCGPPRLQNERGYWRSDRASPRSFLEDRYIQGVLVFTSARVDAKWGTTGKVYCLKSDQLYRYITAGKKGKRLSSHETERIALAFAALAQMDPDFNERRTVSREPSLASTN